MSSFPPCALTPSSLLLPLSHFVVLRNCVGENSLPPEMFAFGSDVATWGGGLWEDEYFISVGTLFQLLPSHPRITVPKDARGSSPN